MFRSIRFFANKANRRPNRFWQKQGFKFPKPFTFATTTTILAGTTYFGFRGILPFSSKYEEEADIKLSKRQQRQVHCN